MKNKLLRTPVERFTRMLFSKVIERLAVVVAEESLSFSQVAALHIIDREGTVNIRDIADRLNLSMSATSRLIDDLVKKNLIERIEDQLNRRSKNLNLTENGCRFMDKLSIERVKIIERSSSVDGKSPMDLFKKIGVEFFGSKVQSEKKSSEKIK